MTEKTTQITPAQDAGRRERYLNAIEGDGAVTLSDQFVHDAADAVMAVADEELRAQQATPAQDDGLRELYAAAIREHFGDLPYSAVLVERCADAVLAVRDRKLERLRAERAEWEKRATVNQQRRRRNYERARQAETELERLRARVAELEAQQATPRELELRQRRGWSAAGRCPMCGYDATDGRLCSECAVTVRAMPARERRQWHRYEPPTTGSPIQGHGYTPTELLGAALDQSAAPDVPAEPCRCSNGYECPHRCWHCKADRAAGCEEWCHIRPFDTEEASR